MTDPFHYGNSGLPESNTPASNSGHLPRRLSYASILSGARANSPPPVLLHPGRSSVISHLLNSPDDPSYDPASTQHYDPATGGTEYQNGAQSTQDPWGRNPQLASFSKAYHLLLHNQAVMEGSNAEENRRFFVPSYLEGSTYVQRLEEAHRAKLQAQRDAQNLPGQTTSSLTTSGSNVSLHGKPASHRGLSEYVVEKPPPPPPDEESVLPPLPTKLNKDDKYGSLDVTANGLEVRYSGSRAQSDRDHEAYSIRADNYMAPQCGIYYFEVLIMAGKRDDTTIGIGFSSRSVALSRPPGWEFESYGYHGDDGNCYAAHSSGKSYGPSFTTGDIIGCGINFRTGSGFFTKNGVLLGTAFKDIKGSSKLYPSVGLKKAGEHVRFNFGQTPFAYDIDGMMNASSLQNFLSDLEDGARQLQNVSWLVLSQLHHGLSEALAARHGSRLGRAGEGHESSAGDPSTYSQLLAALSDFDQALFLDMVRVEMGRRVFSGSPTLEPNLKSPAKEKDRIEAEIAAASTSSLTSPPMKETDLVQSLVLEFLQHDGYVETARAFAQEIHEEKKALTVDPNARVEDINVRDDEHAMKRQRIRRAILEGDIDKALKHTMVFYPDVFKDNEPVYFRLRCRKFIEMVRTAAETRTAAEGKTTNGHVAAEPGAQQMDLDMNGAENGTSDQMDTGDNVERPVGLEDLELETLAYGQSLQADFRHDPRREVTKALEDIYALLAYTNPLKEKDVAHLLDKKGRVAVAEELNAAILLSLGKSSRAALEDVYAQTSVLLDELRENGGPGAFVSLRDVVDEVSRAQQPF